MSDWREGYLEAVKEFLMENGTWVGLEHYAPGRYSWESDDPNEYSSWNTTYGWSANHCHTVGTGRKAQYIKCPVVSLDMSTARERSLSQFEGTFTSHKNEVGLEVRATCECGEYTDKWLRWVGTLQDILPSLLGIEVTTYYG